MYLTFATTVKASRVTAVVPIVNVEGVYCPAAKVGLVLTATSSTKTVSASPGLKTAPKLTCF